MDAAYGSRSVRPTTPETTEAAPRGGVATAPRAAPGARSLLRAARPGQWPKNLLVVAAPVAAGALAEGSVAVQTGVAFAAFCLASSAAYLANDAMDARADRLHPAKRLRPVAAGLLAPRTALVASLVLAATALAVALPVRSGQLALVVAAYLALTASYTLGLKRVAVVELGLVASGFVVRAVAGGAATGIELSRWFLIVSSFGALFVVACKRLAELRELDVDAPAHRQVLADYTPSFLEHARTVAAAVTVGAYCLWAFERADEAAADAWYLLSVVPFVLALLRYALLVDRGAGTAPEEVLLRDRAILALALVWAALFLLGVQRG